MTPALSVLLPCRNAAPWLPDCIASLEAQIEPSFEVVAVDDRSRDGTRELLEAWAVRDPRVRVLDGEGRGIEAALALAARRAGAPLLARMDADDIAHPERLAAQRRFLAERPELAGCGAGFRYFPRRALGSGYRRYERWLNGLHSAEDVRRDLFVECPVAHPTLVLRRSAYEAVGGYRETGWPEDYDLVLRLHAEDHRLANLPRTLLRWRIVPGRLSMVSATYSAEAFRRCKAHHLTRGFLPPERPLALWGAGRVGKGLLKALLAEGAAPWALVDVDPRKVGQWIHGLAVLSPTELGSAVSAGVRPAPSSSSTGRRPDRVAARATRPYVLIAVGSPGARAEIRAALNEMGLRELEDYRAAA